VGVVANSAAPVLELIVQNGSCGLKPVPATPTGWPCDTVAGLSTTNAEGVPTVNVPVAVFPVLSVTVMPYVPATAVPGTTTEPETWPMPADRKHPGAGKGGVIVAVQDVATELKPEPVNVKTVLTVPEVGVTTTLAVTLNTARSMSSAGVPLTCTVQLMSVVA